MCSPTYLWEIQALTQTMLASNSTCHGVYAGTSACTKPVDGNESERGVEVPASGRCGAASVAQIVRGGAGAYECMHVPNDGEVLMHGAEGVGALCGSWRKRRPWPARGRCRLRGRWRGP